MGPEFSLIISGWLGTANSLGKYPSQSPGPGYPAVQLTSREKDTLLYLHGGVSCTSVILDTPQFLFLFSIIGNQTQGPEQARELL